MSSDFTCTGWRPAPLWWMCFECAQGWNFNRVPITSVDRRDVYYRNPYYVRSIVDLVFGLLPDPVCLWRGVSRPEYCRPTETGTGADQSSGVTLLCASHACSPEPWPPQPPFVRHRGSSCSCFSITRDFHEISRLHSILPLQVAALRTSHSSYHGSLAQIWSLVTARDTTVSMPSAWADRSWFLLQDTATSSAMDVSGRARDVWVYLVVQDVPWSTVPPYFPAVVSACKACRSC